MPVRRRRESEGRDRQVFPQFSYNRCRPSHVSRASASENSSSESYPEAGADGRGDAWKPSWEPSKNILDKQMMADFLRDHKERLHRTIEVDTRPLDTLVQRTISQATMTDAASTESFGRVHEREIGALSLKDIAVHYLGAIAERFGLTPRYAYAPNGDVLTTELRIKDPGPNPDADAHERRHVLPALRALCQCYRLPQILQFLLVGPEASMRTERGCSDVHNTTNDFDDDDRVLPQTFRRNATAPGGRTCTSAPPPRPCPTLVLSSAELDWFIKSAE